MVARWRFTVQFESRAALNFLKLWLCAASRLLPLSK